MNQIGGQTSEVTVWEAVVVVVDGTQSGNGGGEG